MTGLISPTFEIKDERFDNSQIAESHLMIEVSRNRFRFCIFHVPSNSFVWLEDYMAYSLINENPLKQTLQNIYQEHVFLAANYWKSIRLSFSSTNFTLIPEEFFISDESAKYLQLVAGKNITDTEQIFDFHHSRFGAVNVFGVEKDILSWFKEMYPVKKITPVHLIDTLLEGIIHEQMTDGLHLHFEDNSVVMVYFKENKLYFCNRFIYKTSADLVYHVLFVMHELNLPTETTLVTFYGEITMFSEGYIMLTEQLGAVRFVNSPKRLKFGKDFDELPEHRYFSLFSSYLLF